MTVIGIGWDVGGWHGKANALVVLRLEDERPALLGMGTGSGAAGATLEDFVEALCGHRAAAAVRTAQEVVLAVDAPLGWPRAFRALVSDPAGPLADPSLPAPFLENPFAFRDTDREVARRFPQRRPMSAAFDRLGNPATLAIQRTRRWTQGRGPCCCAASLRAGASPSVIEVYPALAKQAPTRNAAVLPPWSAAMPADVQPGTHAHDAAIAALMALGARAGDDRLLPMMEPAGGAEDEGAIWVPSDPRWCVPRT